MIRIVMVLSLFMVLISGIASAVDMREIEAIRMDVGRDALIAPVPDNNCSHVYIIKKVDGSIWIYYSSGNWKLRNSSIVKKALIFRGR